MGENKFGFIRNSNSSVFNNVDIPITSNVVLFNGSLSGSVDLYDCYRPSPDSDLKIQLWGLWSQETGLDLVPRQKWELRRDLSGIVFRTAANDDPPFVKTIVDGDQSISEHPRGYVQNKDDSLEGIFLGPSLYGDIWSSLQRITNFSFSMVSMNYTKIESRIADKSLKRLTQ